MAKVRAINPAGDSGWHVIMEGGAVVHITAMEVVDASMSETAALAVVTKLAEEK